jgi:hypothetical protein
LWHRLQSVIASSVLIKRVEEITTD